MNSNRKVYTGIDEFLKFGQSKAISFEYSHLIDIKILVTNYPFNLHDCGVHVQFLEEIVVLG